MPEDGLPLHAALSSHDTVAAVRAVLDKCPDTINATNADGRTALHRAASIGDSAVTTMLLEAKADANAADRHGATALHFAACGGHEDVVQLLIRGHANVKSQDEKGCAPVHFAAVGPSAKLVDLLLGDGSRFAGFCADKEARCAIHWAAEAGRLDIVRAIVGVHMRRCLSMNPSLQRAHKATMVNAQDLQKQTPLGLAKKEKASEAHLEVARYLSKHGGRMTGRAGMPCCSAR
jgi:ankyrin repeat protein